MTLRSRLFLHCVWVNFPDDPEELVLKQRWTGMVGFRLNHWEILFEVNRMLRLRSLEDC